MFTGRGVIAAQTRFDHVLGAQRGRDGMKGKLTTCSSAYRLAGFTLFNLMWEEFNTMYDSRHGARWRSTARWKLR